VRRRRLAWVVFLVGCGGRGDPSGVPATPSASPGLELASEDYGRARLGFRTTLNRHGPSPQPEPFPETPAGSIAIAYRSAGRELSAFVTPDPGDGVRRPAVLFLHGGFAFGGGDWAMTRPFAEAGFAVMVPLLRGENGQGGDFSLFHDEVDDVLAAADRLAALPYVDPGRLFVAGHSAGGTLTLLAAMASPRFRAASAFSGSPDQVVYTQDRPERTPFDPRDIREVRMRSPVAFARSFRCPTRLYHGEDEFWVEGSSVMTAERAKGGGLDVEAVPVPGDHFSSVPEAIRRAIAFFRGR